VAAIAVVPLPAPFDVPRHVLVRWDRGAKVPRPWATSCLVIMDEPEQRNRTFITLAAAVELYRAARNLPVFQLALLASLAAHPDAPLGPAPAASALIPPSLRAASTAWSNAGS